MAGVDYAGLGAAEALAGAEGHGPDGQQREAQQPHDDHGRGEEDGDHGGHADGGHGGQGAADPGEAIGAELARPSGLGLPVARIGGWLHRRLQAPGFCPPEAQSRQRAGPPKVHASSVAAQTLRSRIT